MNTKLVELDSIHTNPSLTSTHDTLSHESHSPMANKRIPPLVDVHTKIWSSHSSHGSSTSSML